MSCCFRCNLDSCLVYASLETVLAQLCATGDVNIPSYSRHCAAKHGLALSGVDPYVFIHDVLATAADRGQLHSILQADAKISSNGSLSIPF